jgi:hypothetical protein
VSSEAVRAGARADRAGAGVRKLVRKAGARVSSEAVRAGALGDRNAAGVRERARS